MSDQTSQPTATTPATGSTPAAQPAKSSTGTAQSPVTQYRVQWRYNRTHEQYIGRTCIRFAPYGTQILPAALVQHPHFQRVKKDFSVAPIAPTAQAQAVKPAAAKPVAGA